MLALCIPWADAQQLTLREAMEKPVRHYQCGIYASDEICRQGTACNFPMDFGEYRAANINKDGNWYNLIPYSWLHDDLPWVQTEYWVRWPLRPPSPLCVVILETNVLIPSQCPLPKYCGPASWVKISEKWYGQELGMCIGAGGSVPDMSDDHPSTPEWGRISSLNIPEDGDVCATSKKYFLVSLNNGTRFVLTAGALVNIPVYDEASAYAMTFLYTEVAMLASSRACPIAPLTEHQLESEFYAPFLSALPPSRPVKPKVMPPASNRSLDHETALVGYEVFTTDNGCVCQGYGMQSSTNKQLKCLNHHYVTKYGIPGQNILRDFIIHVIDIVVDIVPGLFELVRDWVLELATMLNERFKLLEFIVVFGLAIIHNGNPWRSTVVAIVYLLVVGFERE